MCNANIIPTFQSGFRRLHSTATALLHVSDTVLHNIDKCSLSVLITLDYSKAFDTVNHELLLAKLQYHGLSNSALSFLRAYPMNHSQRVLIYNPFLTFSYPRNVVSSVPQGSILSPLLFSVFVADAHSLH